MLAGEGDGSKPTLHTGQLRTLIGYWTPRQRNVTANDAHADHFDMTPADIRGKHLSEVVGTTFYERARPHVDEALRGVERLLEPTLVSRRGVDRYTQESYLPHVVDGHVQGFYLHVADVTDRVHAERDREEAVRLHQIAMNNAPIGKTVLDSSGCVLQVNPALCELLGYSADELVGTDFRRCVDPEDLGSGEADLNALLDRSARQVASERRYLRRDGTTVWMQRNAVLVPGVHGAADVVIAQFQDVSGRRRAEAELARLAVTDPLTGLPNRHALVEYIDHRRTETPEASLGVVFADLDGFKLVNDLHGHAAGDAVLVQAAGRLASLAIAPATAYRLGGDEFVVLNPDTPTPTRTGELAERIRVGLTENRETDPRTVRLTASVGWTWGPTRNVDELVRGADAAMYEQKSSQRRRRRTDWTIVV